MTVSRLDRMNLVLSLHVFPPLYLPLALPCLVLARFPLPMMISNAKEFQQDILGTCPAVKY